MVATRFTSPITWLLLYSYKTEKQNQNISEATKIILIKPLTFFFYLFHKRKKDYWMSTGPVYIFSLWEIISLFQYTNRELLLINFIRIWKSKWFVIRSEISYL